MSGERIGVILSGCGYLDGAEIHEAVLTFLALDQAGVETVCFAPNMELDVVNHLTGQPTGERRNVLEESARIARGRIADLVEANPDTLDGVILPGGYGAAKNLSDFAAQGSSCDVHPEVERVLRAIHAAGKPIGVICIAPVIVARLFGAEGPKLTIGREQGVADALCAMGATHETASCADAVIDGDRLIVSTPAYMLAEWIGEAAPGIQRVVTQVVALARSRRRGKSPVAST